MLLLKSGCTTTNPLCMIILAACFWNPVQSALQSQIIVDPLFADDDESSLLVPVPAADALPGRALRAGTTSRTVAPTLALHGSIDKQRPTQPPPTLPPKRDESTKTKEEPSDELSNQEIMNNLINTLIGPESHYNKFMRPLPDCSAHDCSHKIGVTMSLEFQKLLGVDEKDNQLKMLALFVIQWADHRLAYNGSKVFPHLFDWHPHHDFVAINPHLIWQPDIQLVNAAKPVEDVFEPRAFLFDDVSRLEKGFNIQLKVPRIMTLKCDILMDEFPFDNQTCNFVYQAWSATTEWISFTATNASQNTGSLLAGLTSKNEEFEVTSVTMKNSVVEVSPETKFPKITYTLTLTRYSHYYVASIILPLLMMVLLSVGVFYIDPPGGERIGYNITLILTVMATSFFASERLPKSGGGDTWLERFQATCYIFVMLPLVLTLFCELGRRIAIRLDMAGDDDAGWVTLYVDMFFRVPYAIFTAIFIFVVEEKVKDHCKAYDKDIAHEWAGFGYEESVSALLIFLGIVVIVMVLVGIVDLYFIIRYHMWGIHEEKSDETLDSTKAQKIIQIFETLVQKVESSSGSKEG